MKVIEFFSRQLIVLEPEQKERFWDYLPTKVYRTERNVALVVAATQLCMILLFLRDGPIFSKGPRAIAYFCLYVFLLMATVGACLLYRYTVRTGRHRAFLWVRRGYAVMICAWVLGITAIEQAGGGGIGVYSYMLPTTAAVLLFAPVESGIIFGGTWLALVAVIAGVGNDPGRFFGDMVNGTFVLLLTLVISVRYYASTVKEFCARELIEEQYEEIMAKHQLLEQLARMDQLTGLYNRYYLQEIVYPMFDEYRRLGHHAMCLMLDIDYFKQYNDRYGHLQGDVCLRSIAELVQDLCEVEEAPAIRYGGEEFLIIKMSRQPFDALGLAQRLRAEIQRADLRREDVPAGQVTVSMGLWYSDTCDAADMECAIKRADDALYRAKEQGRDRIVTDGLREGDGTCRPGAD